VVRRTTTEIFRGEDALWFEEHDLVLAQQLLRSNIAADYLKQLNMVNKKRLHGTELNYSILALALCTFAKNILSSDGAVPAISIRRMLEYYGISCNGSVVSITTQLLIEFGFILCVEAKYTTNHWPSL